ncbi:restriction endonuclease subunit S [Lactobacillus kunkeei]|uniref:restriction endonuclease subunit S n=1 Tax=Apilactobacillus kunkeei TaxID=148814 RepID=UPI001363A1F6|nr:restriction endonuclease subunit S [Apilactobacillus kunkeei]NBI00095.1 restriction endonuclease subunit S [Apilactobacillus kunkeei]
MTKTNVPRLRFSEFSGEWREEKLDNLSERITRKNKDLESELPLTISAQFGLIDQETFFNKKVASKDLSNYFLIKNGEFAYNKSYSNGYPFGTIKSLKKYNMGVLSSLYIVFDIKKNNNHLFFDSFFDSSHWHKEVSTKTTEGARNHGLLNISPQEFMNIRILFPYNISEQQKIGDFFAKQDKLIELQIKKVDQLKKLKRGYLQKMFPQEGETVPRLRFSGFSGEWKEEKLGDVTIRFDNKRVPIKESNRVHGCVPYYGANGIQDYVEGMTHTGNNILIAEDGANDINNYPVFHTEGNIWVNNHAHVLKSQKNKSDSLFISYCLKMIPYSKYLTGNGRYKLNADVLMEIKVNIPCLSEQQKIGSFFAKIDKLIEEQSNKLNQLKQQKKAYLQKMFI